MNLSFKELVQEDIGKVFLNENEFSDKHMVNDKSMTVIIDENEMMEREKRFKSTNTDGIYVKQILIYVAAAEYGALPIYWEQIRLDSKRYRVVDAMDESGLYAITLEAIRG